MVAILVLSVTELEQVRVGLIMRIDELRSLINAAEALPSTEPVDTSYYRAKLDAAESALKKVP